MIAFLTITSVLSVYWLFITHHMLKNERRACTLGELHFMMQMITYYNNKAIAYNAIAYNRGYQFVRITGS